MSNNTNKTLKKRKEIGILSMIFIFIMIIIQIPFIAGIWTSLDFEDDKLTQNQNMIDETRYGTYVINEYSWWDVLGLFTKKPIINKTLTYNTAHCLINCEARGTTILNEDGLRLFDKMEFFDRVNNLRDVSYQIYIKKIETYSVEVPIFKEVCIKDNQLFNESELFNEFSSIEEKSNCFQQIESWKNETKEREVWIEYNYETLPQGTYYWKIKGFKNSQMDVDWIGEVLGNRLTNWAWWNSNWEFKRTITISENTGLSWTNYSVRVIIPFDSNMRTDFGDLRFTNFSDNFELDYWIESRNSTAAVVWVETPLRGGVVNTINMYYGNSLVQTTGNSSRAFLFDDDGTTNRTNEWSCLVDGGSMSLSWNNGEYSNWWNGGSSNLILCYPRNIPYVQNLRVEWSRRVPATWGFGEDGAGHVTAAVRSINTGSYANNSYFIQDWVDTNWWRVLRRSLGIETILRNQDGISTPPNLIYNYTMSVWGNTINATRINTDGSNRVNIFHTGITNRSGVTGLTLYADNNNRRHYFYRFRVRQFGSPEPSVEISSVVQIRDSLILNHPPNNFLTNNNSIRFNCSANNVVSLELILNNTINFSIITAPLSQNLSFEVIRNLSDGFHTWGCRIGRGSPHFDSIEKYRNLTIVSVPPTINIISPLNNTEIQSFLSSTPINFNITLLNRTTLSECLFFNGTQNNSIPCGNNVTINLSSGFNTLQYFATDIFSNLGSNTTTFFINHIRENVSFIPNMIEEQKNQIYFNLIANRIFQANATLIYDGIPYLMTPNQINNTFIQFSSLVNIPIVTQNRMINFSIQYNLNNQFQQTINHSQLIFNIPNLTIQQTCPSHLPTALTFSLIDEETLNPLTGTFNFNFIYGHEDSNLSLVTNFGRINNAINFSVCINNTLSPNWKLFEGQVFYNVLGYTERRYYTFENLLINSTTNNFILYNLPTTQSTSFVVRIRNPDLSPYGNKFVSLLRWYPELNDYRIVEMGKTDQRGETILNVKTENIDYRIGIYHLDGRLIHLTLPMRIICLIQPCVFTLTIKEELKYSFDELIDIRADLNFNYETGIFTLIYNDPSQNSETIILNVYRLSQGRDNLICHTNSSSFTGILSCNVSEYSGTLKAVAIRKSSPERYIALKIIENIRNMFQGTFGLFLQFLLTSLFIFLGIINPIASIFLGVISLIFGVFLFRIFSLTNFIGLIIISAIIIHFIRRK